METENTSVQETPSTQELNIWSNDAQTPVIEQAQPIQEAAPVEEPPIQQEVPPQPTTEPTVVEKEVEKIIEKEPEFKDEYSKEIYEAILEGREEKIKEYLDEKYKNYETYSDPDLIKEKLKKEHSNWDQKRIDAEVRAKYGKGFETINIEEIDEDQEPDKYASALKHNEDVENRLFLLERDAMDAKLWLNEQKKNIELPKITNKEAQAQIKAPTQEEIDESNRKWEAHVAQELPKLSDIKFNVGGEEISYKLTEEDKKAQAEYMKSFDGSKMAQDRGWVDANGKEDILKIAKDLLILNNIDKIIASASTQVKTAAKKEVIAEIKNVDLTPQPITSEPNSAGVEELIWK